MFYLPNYLGHADNYIPANPSVTPTHIVPEWYFLPFYAILRAIPNKLGGVVAMFGSIGVWSSCPGSTPRGCAPRPIVRSTSSSSGCSLSSASCSAGSVRAAEGWYVIVSQIATAYYFVHFLSSCRCSASSSGRCRCRIRSSNSVIGKGGAGIPAGANAEPETKG